MAAPTGNTNAKKARIWEQAIKRALARKANSTVDAGLDKLADQLVSMAIDDKQPWAMIEVGNRMDGKPAQAIVGDSEFDPVQVKAMVELVKPSE